MALQVNQLFDALSRKDVVTAADSLRKAHRDQEVAEVTESDVGIGAAGEYPFG